MAIQLNHDILGISNDQHAYNHNLSDEQLTRQPSFKITLDMLQSIDPSIGIYVRFGDATIAIMFTNHLRAWELKSHRNLPFMIPAPAV